MAEQSGNGWAVLKRLKWAGRDERFSTGAEFSTTLRTITLYEKAIRPEKDVSNRVIGTLPAECIGIVDIRAKPFEEKLIMMEVRPYKLDPSPIKRGICQPETSRGVSLKDVERFGHIIKFTIPHDNPMGLALFESWLQGCLGTHKAKRRRGLIPTYIANRWYRPFLRTTVVSLLSLLRLLINLAIMVKFVNICRGEEPWSICTASSRTVLDPLQAGWEYYSSLSYPLLLLSLVPIMMTLTPTLVGMVLVGFPVLFLYGLIRAGNYLMGESVKVHDGVVVLFASFDTFYYLMANLKHVVLYIRIAYRLFSKFNKKRKTKRSNQAYRMAVEEQLSESTSIRKRSSGTFTQTKDD